MIKLGLEPVPDSFNSEQAEYLNRVISQLIDSINSVHDMDSEINYPVNQDDGMFRYSIGEGDFKDGAGFYGRVDGEWSPIGGNAFNECGGLDFKPATCVVPDTASIYYDTVNGFSTWFGKTENNEYRMLGFAYSGSSNIGFQPHFDQIKLKAASYLFTQDGSIAYAVGNDGEPMVLLNSRGSRYKFNLTKV